MNHELADYLLNDLLPVIEKHVHLGDDDPSGGGETCPKCNAEFLCRHEVIECDLCGVILMPKGRRLIRDLRELAEEAMRCNSPIT